MMSRGVYLAEEAKARSNVARVRVWDASSKQLRGTLFKVRVTLGKCKVPPPPLL